MLLPSDFARALTSDREVVNYAMSINTMDTMYPTFFLVHLTRFKSNNSCIVGAFTNICTHIDKETRPVGHTNTWNNPCHAVEKRLVTAPSVPPIIFTTLKFLRDRHTTRITFTLITIT